MLSCTLFFKWSNWNWHNCSRSTILLSLNRVCKTWPLPFYLKNPILNIYNIAFFLLYWGLGKCGWIAFHLNANSLLTTLAGGSEVLSVARGQLRAPSLPSIQFSLFLSSSHVFSSWFSFTIWQISLCSMSVMSAYSEMLLNLNTSSWSCLTYYLRESTCWHLSHQNYLPTWVSWVKTWLYYPQTQIRTWEKALEVRCPT